MEKMSGGNLEVLFLESQRLSVLTLKKQDVREPVTGLMDLSLEAGHWISHPLFHSLFSLAL